MSRDRLVSTIGAGICLILFVVLVLPTTIVYGSWTGLILSSSVLGTPVPMNILSKTLIAGGAALASISIGSVCMVFGSMIASAVYFTGKVVKRGLSVTPVEQ